MNRRQRRRRGARRAHHARIGGVDRPALILDRDSFPDVKSAHIVPRMYQRAFAVDDQVQVHLVGEAKSVLMPTRNAATRSRFYRRFRPGGEPIDDIEASLAYVEEKASGPLAELIAGQPITVERKGGVAQLLGLQMLRGPAFFEQREELVREMLGGLERAAFRPRAIAAAGRDLDRLRQELTAAYLDPTNRFLTMLTGAVKIASVLSHMRWQVVRFPGPLLAYSDHPVVSWPIEMGTSRPLKRQQLGPLGALEIRVPLAPDVALLMTWVDRSDATNVTLGPLAAAEINAFTVGQADRQWMHRPGTTPPVPTGVFAPLSRLLDPAYDRAVALRSARHSTAAAFIDRVKDRRHVNDIEVLVDVPALLAPAV
jgi:hypothetical protein